MRRTPMLFTVPSSTAEPCVDITDDGGSGLFDACRARFAVPQFEVECDTRHTVWVKRTGGTRSFGLAPWAVRHKSVAEILAGVEAKLNRR